jgi:hypothetical protein
MPCIELERVKSEGEPPSDTDAADCNGFVTGV